MVAGGSPAAPQAIDCGDVMKMIRILLVLALGLGLGAAGQYWYAHRSSPAAKSPIQTSAAAAADRPILYYRDPSGAPRWSAVPKKDEQGRDYLPVYDDQEPLFDSKPTPPKAAQADRKILFYRNPMGLPDTSPVPKKDSMGMDYIPVYEGDERGDASTVTVSLDRVQRSGVRTETVDKRVLVQPVRAVGAVAIDESRQTVVTMRADGFIEDLFVNTTGRTVQAGEPLFRIYSPDILNAQVDFLTSVSRSRTAPGPDAERSINGTMQRLRNLGIPESRIRELREHGINHRTIDWPAPATGTVVSKRIVNGQRVQAGDELYRIIDLTRVWVIADVAEADLGLIRLGTHAVVTFRAYPTEPAEGTVTLIYPEVKSETRTARVRIEVANADGRLKTDMYADVVFRPGEGDAPVVAIPNGAVIDSGTRQVVLVARGEGRFEPRPVKLGRAGDGYREVLEGLSEGESIVTTATFLIDAESNLQTALKAFMRGPEQKDATK
jgi:Cu(I)/Ag(I) efflux system membrane fusion protein